LQEGSDPEPTEGAATVAELDIRDPSDGEQSAREARERGRSDSPPADRKPRLERLQVCVAKQLMDRCWDIASIDRVTVASLVEEALKREIRRRESERGEPYPRRRDWRLLERRAQ
jgi:hypothetical protein